MKTIRWNFRSSIEFVNLNPVHSVNPELREFWWRSSFALWLCYKGCLLSSASSQHVNTPGMSPCGNRITSASATYFPSTRTLWNCVLLFQTFCSCWTQLFRLYFQQISCGKEFDRLKQLVSDDILNMMLRKIVVIARFSFRLMSTISARLFWKQINLSCLFQFIASLAIKQEVISLLRCQVVEAEILKWVGPC